jgi:putative hydrolase of the HAD superfamily
VIRAIIFDFGGVLMRTKKPPLGRQEWEARLGLPVGDLERVVHGSGAWIRCQRGQISPDEYWAQIAERLGIPSTDIPKLKADYFRDDVLDLDLIGLIKDLRKAGIVTALLSNDSIALEAKLRDDLGIYDLFNAVVISAQINVIKPDPGAYTTILDRLGVKPADAMFIDDSMANIDGASALGMQTLAYQTNFDVRAYLAKLLPNAGL